MEHDADIEALKRQLDEANAALAALRKSEAHYRTLYSSFDEGFMEVEVVQDADGRDIDIRYVTVNPALERLTGLRDIEGRLSSEVVPNREPEWVERFGQVARTGEAVRFEMPASGLGRWFSVYLARIGPAGSRRVVAIYSDVTEGKRAELASQESGERQAFLLRLSDALRAEPSAEAITNRALRMLMEQMRLDRCYNGIYRLAEDIGEFPHQVHNDRLPPLPAQVRLSDFPDALQVAFSRTVVIDDVVKMEDLSDVDRAGFNGLGMRALIAATLRKGENNPLWAICAVSTAPRGWTKGEVSLVEEVAERTWAAVERARAEAALRESDERFAQFAASSTDVLWIRRADTMEMEYLSPAFATVYGMDPNEILGGVHRWAALIVPDDRDVALGHLETARQGEATVHEFRIRRPSDGAFRWIRDHDFPLRDKNGVKWIGGIATDVTEARLLVEHQSILLAELQHRVRNIMAMLRSMVTRTARTASDVAGYESSVTGRLMALARTQALLTRAANVEVEITALVRQELEALADHEGQYVLTGSEVVISPKAAEVISLAVHELATNALKYGALSTPEGRVEVNVRVLHADVAPRLRLEWSERRPAPPDWSPPKRKGFGTQLIEQRVPYELRGRGEVVIEPEGVKAFIEFPLQPGASILETDAPMLSVVYGGAIDMTGEPSLAGQSVLILEDDFYLAQDAATALREAGAEVIGPFATIEDATEAIKSRRVTAAMLDVNLGNGPSFEVADAMRGAGAPFVFVTGYDQDTIPAEFAHVVRLEKPIEPRDIVRAIGALAEA
ncbi:PAS domain S-box protein [Caulobacter sp. DWR1-3-2b1]|uniref:PAS domain S-box protein n=1 Tax=Caulobacter sp. DWR1-3-2b1 TaxID=2804670 RepID=UPI003CF63D20